MTSTSKPPLNAARLAIEGGTPEIISPPSRGARWGNDEKVLLDAMLGQSSLFYWKNTNTELFVQRFKTIYPFHDVMPCSSGTAAIHIAIISMGLEPGDEVIVPPITDMGTIIGILYQMGVPVFADLEAHSYNLDPEDVRRKISAKTRAIVAVHLAGNPCAIKELRELADEFNLILIEDCAQAWGAKSDGQPVGTFGHFGCYSLNDFKHISCGDGGIVGTSDAQFGPLLQKSGDKGYDRLNGIKAPDFLAPNYRISEPQSAIAAAQVNRMEDITSKRAELGAQLGQLLSDIPGIHPHRVTAGASCTFWFYLMRLGSDWKCDRNQFVRMLAAEGVEAVAGYIPTPLYRYPVFHNHAFFGGSWPIQKLGLTNMDYRTIRCPVAEEILESCVYLRIHEGMDKAYIEGSARAIRKISARHHGGNA